MISIDDRIGSGDLAGHLRHWHVPCEVVRLEFGDAAFTGNGPRGPIAVGVEVKKVPDALNCMRDGRFAGHQLPGLVRTYDRVWLILEGRYTVDFRSGLLTTDSGKEYRLGTCKFMFGELDNWLTTMENCAAVRVKRTSDRVETARVLANLHNWYIKPYADHSAHLAIHSEAPDSSLFTRPSVARMVAAQLPGIGFKKSLSVVKKFGTVEGMINATVDDWAEVEGIGDTLAERVFAALRK